MPISPSEYFFLSRINYTLCICLCIRYIYIYDLKTFVGPRGYEKNNKKRTTSNIIQISDLATVDYLEFAVALVIADAR